ncbi:hypothetical protein KUIN1_48110 [Pseudomonas sp. KUIN-1]|nr:hypothetical protein KUIN1_48110 [Pseudomonas sp. KUIN-1]
MSGYVPRPALPNASKSNSGVEPVDIHAQRWAEYKVHQAKEDTKPNTVGCVFAKSCDLPDGVIDHEKPAGFIPAEKVANYGDLSILGGRETDADGKIHLKKISGSALPTALGTLLCAVQRLLRVFPAAVSAPLERLLLRVQGLLQLARGLEQA